MGTSQFPASSVPVTMHPDAQPHLAFALLTSEYCNTGLLSCLWMCGVCKLFATSCTLWSMVLWRRDFKVTEVWPGWQTSRLSVATYFFEIQGNGNTWEIQKITKQVTVGPIPADIRHEQRPGGKPGRGSTGSRAADSLARGQGLPLSLPFVPTGSWLLL